MHFGGLQPTSFIDFPGRISCVLFVSGCNFRCPYCHNPDLARGTAVASRRIEEARFFSFLDLRGDFLEGVVISGGEPTLFDGLPALCRRIRKRGFAVKLDTNGSRPEMLRRLIDDGLVDYVAMDVKTDPRQYARWIWKDCRPETILASIDGIRASDLPHEFRTTCIRPLVEPDTIGRIGAHIGGAPLWALQQCRPQRVLDPAFIASRCTPYRGEELLELKSLAAPWVQRCVVR